MKKVIAGALTILLSLLGFIGLSFATIAPASAGNDKVFICHSNEGENGSKAGWNYIEVNKNGAVSGHAGLDHREGKDIIPIFEYIEKVDGVNTRYTFPGQNTTKTEEQFSAADCPSDTPDPELVKADPNPPTYVPATCANPALPYGQLVIPADLGTGVASASEPVFGHNNATLSTTYTLKADTAETVYEWKDVNGETKTFTFNTVHISSDPLWVVDGETGVGACELSNTGLFGLSEEVTYAGGALLALGLAFVIGNAVTRRRNA